MDTPDYITLPLTRGYVALIDHIDSDLAQFKWCANTAKSGSLYAKRAIQIGNKHITILLHRVILARILGRDLLPGEEPDHIERNGLDCRRSKLRLATHQQNCYNRVRALGQSGYRGVRMTKNKQRYSASITLKGKNVYLGTYDTVELAALAYDQAAVKHFGEFAVINFPSTPNHSESDDLPGGDNPNQTPPPAPRPHDPNDFKDQ